MAIPAHIASGPRPSAGVPDFDENDPFRYGWRDVIVEHPDGTSEWLQLPLSEEDILYPHEGDHIVQQAKHYNDTGYLHFSLKSLFTDEPTTLVFSDLGILWPDETQHIAPDVAVIFGVRPRADWKTFTVREEGTGPVLIIELISPSTAKTDRETKFASYARKGVAYYILIERRGQVIRFWGYQLRRGVYRLMKPDAQGRIWLPPVQVWLGTEEDELALYTLDETRLLHPAEWRAANAAMEERLAAEAAARTLAEERFAAEAAARSAAEEQAQALAKQVAAMEEELRRLRGV